MSCSKSTLSFVIIDAAGNFLCLAENLSSNAFRNVLDIDTNGTFNVTMAVFQQFFKVSAIFFAVQLSMVT